MMNKIAVLYKDVTLWNSTLVFRLKLYLNKNNDYFTTNIYLRTLFI